LLMDMKVKSAKGKDKAYKLTDGQGLYLLVTPAGGKLWRFKYRFGGKEKGLVFGTYPEISLADAREKREPRASRSPMRLTPARCVRRRRQRRTRRRTASRSWHGSGM
jgi:hypothetical protein